MTKLNTVATSSRFIQPMDFQSIVLSSDATKSLIDKLLKERISLEGIVRVSGVSQKWLLSYIEKKYAALPDDLNADLSIPEEPEEYLDERMEEEIERLKKKALKELKNIV